MRNWESLGELGAVKNRQGRWVRPAPDYVRLIGRLPASVQRQTLAEWCRRANADGGWRHYHQTNCWLADFARAFIELPRGIAGIGLGASDGEICGAAAEAARRFIRYERSDRSLENMLGQAAEDYGLSAKTFRRCAPEGILGRLKDEKFWRRHLRRYIGRLSEQKLREIGNVSRRSGLYASHEAVQRRRAQKQRSRSLLAELAAINELGQEFTLEALSDLGVSNPEIRRAELMVRIRGLEEIAKLHGDIGIFFTITCPSRFHKMHHFGKPNEKFSGETPAEAQAYLNQVWQRIRAELARKGIKVYGFRVAEPHHDGTPHWHGLIFIDPKHADGFRRTTAKHACREERQELGLRYCLTDKEAKEQARSRQLAIIAAGQTAPSLKTLRAGIKTEAEFWEKKSFQFWRHNNPAAARVDFEIINWQRGTAAGYIAKYIAKNIDGKNHYGESVGVDYESEELAATTETAERVDAWATHWGIRQFQQIGGAPVTVWRELRRIEPTADDSTLMLAARAADRGDWAQFVLLLGGATAARKVQPVALYKQESQTPNRYGEIPADQIMGVYEKATGEVQISRIHNWQIKRNGGSAAAWTCVNNCTILNRPSENAEKLRRHATRYPQKTNQSIEEAEIKEWLISRHAVSLNELQHLTAQMKTEAQTGIMQQTILDDITPPVNAEVLSRLIQNAKTQAEQAAQEAERRRYYRDYLAALDRLRAPLTNRFAPEPEWNLNAVKTLPDNRHYTPPQYDTPETALKRSTGLRRRLNALMRKQADNLSLN